jgi:hypothetical protein
VGAAVDLAQRRVQDARAHPAAHRQPSRA